MVQLDRDQVLAYRYTVNGLHTRLPMGELVAAARPGLQDSAPFSAVLSLGARVTGVAGDAWTDGRMTQVWGPRGAVYLIPKEDLGVFTLGLWPRDQARLEQLNRQAHRVLRMLDGRPQRPSSVLDAMGATIDTRELRWTSTTGWFLPIWDASTTAIYPAEPVDADPEACRVELARRFFHYLGPSTTKALQWWTGSSTEDATASVRSLAPELATIDVADQEVLMLAADVDMAVDSPRPSGLHMLPPDDVYISRLCGRVLVPTTELRERLYPEGPLPGAIVVDGEVVAVWRRLGRRFTVKPLPGSKIVDRATEVAVAAAEMPLPDDPEETAIDWDLS